MTTIPSLLLKQLYTNGSLKNIDKGITFSLKNRLSDASLTKLIGIKIDGKEIPLKDISIDTGNGKPIAPSAITAEKPVEFALKGIINIIAKTDALKEGIE